jgi:hypothetical protein
MKNWILTHLNSIFISLIAVIAPIKPLFLVTGFLIMVDFIFGIYKARKLKEKITSRKMGNTISKLLLYNLAILSVFLLNKYIINTQLPLEKIVAGLIGLTEVKSLDESFKLLFGFSFYDKIIKIMKRGASTTKDLIEEVDDTTENK